jgi:hypothetical protein
MSLPALLFLLVVFSLALLGEFLLWRALRQDNRLLLHRTSGLVLLVFGLLALIVLLILLDKLFSQPLWPWTWVRAGLKCFLTLGVITPLFWVGIDLVWKVAPAALTARIDWSWLLIGPGVGCLIGVIAGFH